VPPQGRTIGSKQIFRHRHGGLFKNTIFLPHSMERHHAFASGQTAPEGSLCNQGHLLCLSSVSCHGIGGVERAMNKVLDCVS